MMDEGVRKWTEDELVPLLTSAYGFRPPGEWQRRIETQAKHIKTLPIWEDFETTIERVRLLLVNSEILTRAELKDFGWLRDEIDLCIGVFIRHAIVHGIYPLWSLGEDSNPDHPRRKITADEQDTYIFGGKFAARRPRPAKGRGPREKNGKNTFWDKSRPQRRPTRKPGWPGWPQSPKNDLIRSNAQKLPSFDASGGMSHEQENMGPGGGDPNDAHGRPGHNFGQLIPPSNFQADAGNVLRPTASTPNDVAHGAHGNTFANPIGPTYPPNPSWPESSESASGYPNQGWFPKPAMGQRMPTYTSGHHEFPTLTQPCGMGGVPYQYTHHTAPPTPPGPSGSASPVQGKVPSFQSGMTPGAYDFLPGAGAHGF